MLVKSSGKFCDVTRDVAPVGASDTVGERLRLLRKQRGLSVEEMADRCAAAGAPELTANSLYTIENGRRKGGERTRRVTVDELIALAYALGVSPLALLVPSAPSAYAVTPGCVFESAARLYDWIIGRMRESPGDNPETTRGRHTPVGLPDYLADRENRLIAESERELDRLRQRITEMALAIVGDPQPPNVFAGGREVGRRLAKHVPESEPELELTEEMLTAARAGLRDQLAHADAESRPRLEGLLADVESRLKSL